MISILGFNGGGETGREGQAGRPGNEPITRQMELLFLLVLLDSPQYLLVLDTDGLQQTRHVLDREVAVRTPMALARAGGVLGQDLLAAEGAVAVAPPIAVPSHIAIRVADIIPILLVECIVRDLAEALSPEDQAFFEIQTDAFEE
jgi:hypothetical protein